MGPVSLFGVHDPSHILTPVGVLEISAKHPAQFVVGRVVLYFSVAFCEVTVTTYQAELGMFLLDRKLLPNSARVVLILLSSGKHASIRR